MARNASASEVTAARAFLKFLGRDWRNQGLVLAVIAWSRVASGRMSGSLGSNPFRLYRLGNGNYVTYGFKGSGGKAASFATLTQAFVAAAKALKYMQKTFRGQGFNEIVLSLRSGDAGEFLTQVAVSAWSSSHYGLKIVNGKWAGTNKLISAYNLYDGLITPEAEAEARAAKAKQEAEQRAWERAEAARKAALAKYKRRPKQLNPPAPSRTYLNPYAADRLYDERHPPYELPD